jgi:hypothetical protein
MIAPDTCCAKSCTYASRVGRAALHVRFGGPDSKRARNAPETISNGLRSDYEPTISVRHVVATGTSFPSPRKSSNSDTGVPSYAPSNRNSSVCRTPRIVSGAEGASPGRKGRRKRLWSHDGDSQKGKRRRDVAAERKKRKRPSTKKSATRGLPRRSPIPVLLSPKHA